ncbi:MAG: tetratricopeptide repeat protein [Candidatus Eisenbacteria bacterium]
MISFSLISLGPSLVGVALFGGRTQVDPKDVRVLPLPWKERQHTPDLLGLLDWRTRVSDFVARESEMSDLRSWADSPASVSVRFIVGESGAGKSRLAAEFADELRKKGWAAGFVDLSDPPPAVGLASAGTLAVIDDPEEQVGAVREFLEDLANADEGVRFKALLLTRQPAHRWMQTVYDAKASSVVDTRPVELSRMSIEGLHALYNSTEEVASSLLGTTTPPVSVEQLQEWVALSDGNDIPLFVVASALHAASNPDDVSLGCSGRAVAVALAQREVARLRRLAANHCCKSAWAYAKLLTLAALRGSLTRGDVMGTAGDTGILANGDDDCAVFERIQEAGLMADDVVQPPRPDVLAAALVVLTAEGIPHESSELVWLGVSGNLASSLLKLERLSHDADYVLGMSSGALGKSLAAALRGKMDRCTLVVDAFIRHPLPDSLLVPAVATWETMLEADPDRENRASILNNLANHLTALGDSEPALVAAYEAVELRRALLVADGLTARERLAGDLGTLSTCLQRVGRDQEALEAIDESVAMRRELAHLDRHTFLAGYARSLNAQSNCLAGLGRNEESIAAALEALRLRRELAVMDPDRFNPELATSLSNTANRLRRAGRIEDAIQLCRQAIAIRERLAERSPSRYEPYLAASYNGLSDCLASKGDFEAALDSSLVATTMLRRVATMRGSWGKARLGTGLNTLAERHLDLRESGEAIRVAEEATDIHRSLASRWPVKYRPPLVTSLGLLARGLVDAGECDAAGQILSEARGIIPDSLDERSKPQWHEALEDLRHADKCWAT